VIHEVVKFGVKNIKIKEGFKEELAFGIKIYLKESVFWKLIPKKFE
jgi:hypothetical protein